MSLKSPFTNDDVLKAIELFSAECWGALKFGRALGGAADDGPWSILHANTLPEIIAEADARGLDHSKLLCAVTETPVIHSGYYNYACGRMDWDGAIHKFRQECKYGDGHWKPVPDVVLKGWPAHVKIEPRPGYPAPRFQTA